MKKLLACAFASVLANLLASQIYTDENGEYQLDSAGEKHYLLFQRTFTGDCGGGAYTFIREKAADTTIAAAQYPWKNGHIWTFADGVEYGKAMRPSRTCDIYGLRFEDADFFVKEGEKTQMSFEGPTLKIGAGGIVCEKELFKMYFYNSSEEKRFHLTASQTWKGPDSEVLTANAFNLVVNEPYRANYRNTISSEPDIVWTLAGNLYVNMLTYENDLSSADVVICHPSIMSIPVHGDHGSGRLKARSLTIDGGVGIYFGENTALTFDATMSWKYGIGSRPLISPEQIAPTVILTNGAVLTAVKTTSVTGGVTVVSAGEKSNAFSGTFSLDDENTVISVSEGSTLDLTAAKFVGSGRATVTGAGDLTVKFDGSDYFDLPFQFDGFTGEAEITVASGTLVLDSIGDLPAGFKITTSGGGALLLVDDAGFDAETMLGGTANKVEPSGLLVTDKDVAGEVVVNSGETMLVFGDGLGENARLTLWDNAKVMFRRNNSVISCPIWSTNTTYVQTFDSSVTGNVAGAWWSDNGSQIRITSPGLLVLSGGGRIDDFRMDSGRCDVVGAYDVYGTQYFYGGHMKVRDGGHIRVMQSWQYLRLDYNDGKDTCLEILPGGIFEKVAGNCYTYIGKNANTESRLLVNGGRFKHEFVYFAVKPGAVIEVRDGDFITYATITCLEGATAENCRMILRGGTATFSGGSAGYCPAMFRGDGRCAVVVDGDATLRYINQSVTFDSTNDVSTCIWKSTPASRLKLVGNGDNTNVFTIHDFQADGLAFDLNDKNAPKKVVIDAPGDPLRIGCVLPGNGVSRIVNTNETVALVADYIAPEGVTMDVSSLPSGWHEGFAPVAVSNLTVDAGGSLSFDFFTDDCAPIAIAGKLSLPGAMDYLVNAPSSRSNVKDAAVVVPALGVETDDGFDWNCIGKVKPEQAALSVLGGSLVFSYNIPATIILLR